MFGVLDMLVQPSLMLLAAPLLLGSMGAISYGTWMLVNSIAATVASLGGGFGDAAIKSVSEYRGRRDVEGVRRSFGTALYINALLGSVLTAILLLSADLVVSRVFRVSGELLPVTVSALRIGSLVLLCRHIEAVFIAVLKAYERYAPAVVISSFGKIAIIVAAVLLARQGRGLVALMTSTLAIAVSTLAMQAVTAFHVSGVRPSLIRSDRQRIAELGRFGTFTWMKSVSSVGFSYADRLLVGALLGMSSLAYYTVCIQAAQLIPAVCAAGLHFLFPRMSSQLHGGETEEALESYRRGVAITVVAALGSLLLVPTARTLLTIWMGAHFATVAWSSFAVMILAHAVLTLSIVPQYAALALNKAHWLAAVNLVAAGVSLASGASLMNRFGLVGAAGMKMMAAAISLSIFLVASRGFRQRVLGGSETSSSLAASVAGSAEV